MTAALKRRPAPAATLRGRPSPAPRRTRRRGRRAPGGRLRRARGVSEERPPPAPAPPPRPLRPPRTRRRCATAPRRTAPRRPGRAAPASLPSMPSPPAMQHSASATARPPWEQSWAERSKPRRIASRQTRCTRTSRSRSISGRPATRPCISRRYSLPASDVAGASRLAPSRNTSSPSRWKPIAQRRSTSSSSPSMPTTGVGRTGSPFVSLYRLTLPEMTGVAELLAGRRHAANRLLHLVVDVQLLRVAEIEAVRDGYRLGARRRPRFAPPPRRRWRRRRRGSDSSRCRFRRWSGRCPCSCP